MKKILSILLVIVLTCGFAGCGNSTDSSQEASSKSEEASGEKFVIGITQWPGSYVWYGTEKLGYFEKTVLMPKSKCLIIIQTV